MLSTFAFALSSTKISVLKLTEMFCVFCGQTMRGNGRHHTHDSNRNKEARNDGKCVRYNEHAFITLSMVFDVENRNRNL